jgi:glycosyltransferase involved in cell wall biosynthesis
MEQSALLDVITPLLITLDEAPNIARTLEKLRWARRIVVIDSGSIDGTLEILAQYPQIDHIHRPFDSFADQCNFGLSQVRTAWVLSLDADYELSDDLVREIGALQQDEGVWGYRVSFIYRIYGRPLRGTLYPPRTVLHRVQGASYANEGHGHRVMIAGKVRWLGGVIYHDDRKPLSRWLASQKRYAELEAEYLLKARTKSLSRTDRLRRMGWPAPALVLAYLLVVKACLLDGWPGWFYALQRLLAESMIALELIDRRLRQVDEERRNHKPVPPFVSHER